MTGVRTLGPVVAKDKDYPAVLWVHTCVPGFLQVHHPAPNITKIKTNFFILSKNYRIGKIKVSIVLFSS